MFKRSRRVEILGLVLGCGLLSAVACSSDQQKNVDLASEAGAGGDAEAGAGAALAAGGTAGETGAASEAGQGGVNNAAGAAGNAHAASAGEGGASEGGAGPLGCEPQGSVTMLSIPPSEAPQTACRGARVLAQFSGTTDPTFTCCGISDTAQPYAVTVTGERTQAAGNDLLVAVPANAPLGLTSISMSCSSGAVSPTIDFQVVDKSVPVVSDASRSIFADGTLTISGQNLKDVSQVTAIPVTGKGVVASCFYGTNISATAISCVFDGIAPGDYYIAVNEAGCGYALNTPLVTIKPVQ